MAADIDQDTGEIGADSGERPLHTLMRGDDEIANVGSDVGRTPAAATTRQK